MNVARWVGFLGTGLLVSACGSYSSLGEVPGAGGETDAMGGSQSMGAKGGRQGYGGTGMATGGSMDATGGTGMGTGGSMDATGGTGMGAYGGTGMGSGGGPDMTVDRKSVV